MPGGIGMGIAIPIAIVGGIVSREGVFFAGTDMPGIPDIPGIAGIAGAVAGFFFCGGGFCCDVARLGASIKQQSTTPCETARRHPNRFTAALRETADV